MKKLVFATNNKHKLEEVQAILGNTFEIVSLNEIGCFDEIPETADTLEGNALLKAKYVFDKYALDCFADDTGLEIEALGGAPGVYSARFAGEECDSAKNMQKVLKLMDGIKNREACFKTVIALILQEKTYYFEGKICGTIAEKPGGNAGFGYDPIFIPEGYDKSFAELTPEIKNKISHRALAVKKLSDFLI
ncbi:non-canonical purine NTP diphosphatase [Paludibacter sp. 221]|uniref:non-canonical purine NTP diphosphatase n=1 Tax=Paludibacter sp. 221 TaxID=2302939 RepID=UPI0013D2C663|nr:non-canonical purine NTP diphosphatase [Paludibacter sp. 221]NDV45924.1 non-canonical purine NTP diphosphatase [Paludibacter sp. 221]